MKRTAIRWRTAAALAALLGLWGCGGASPQAGPATLRPNILVLVADDLGWNDIGYHHSEIRTPNLDRLAAAGVRLERHYVYPTCSPTRAGLLTGRNPSRFGIHSPIADRSDLALPADTLTIAGLLKGQGYRTALSGKWHLGLRPETGPRRYGFDESYGFLHGQVDPASHRYKNGDRTWHRNEQFLDEPGHPTDLIAQEAVRIIERPDPAPFFLYVAFSAPHHPLLEPDRWTAPYASTIPNPARRLYAATVSHLDAAIGTIVEALERTGKTDQTLILFTSDNGGQKDYRSETEYEGKYGPYEVMGDNRPWRGWKDELYEGGVRVPAFVRWPHHLAPALLEAPVSVMDWLPTFGRLAGSALPAASKVDGRDVWPLLNGRSGLESRTFYWNIGSSASVVVDHWKLIVHLKKSLPEELYDLATDPQETRNLAATQRPKVEELLKCLAAERKLDPD
jgi:arylsulfatase A-like enzyme